MKTQGSLSLSLVLLAFEALRAGVDKREPKGENGDECVRHGDDSTEEEEETDWCFRGKCQEDGKSGEEIWWSGRRAGVEAAQCGM